MSEHGIIVKLAEIMARMKSGGFQVGVVEIRFDRLSLVPDVAKRVKDALAHQPVKCVKLVR